jgi:DNA-binding transcriptional LysR family regulator
MEFRQLKTFRVVAEQLSFTRAAEQLFMAQSSVSAQIRGLEEELKVMLFDRIGRRVLLTEAGRKLYDYARRIEGMTDEMKSEVAGERYGRGSLTIRMPETLATVYMVPVIEEFNRDYPEVRLIFINCADRQLARELNAGSIDLAFLMTDELQMKDVQLVSLKSEELVLAASPGHPLAAKDHLAPADLVGQTILYPKTD